MNHDPVSVSTRARLTVTRVNGHSSAASNPSRRALTRVVHHTIGLNLRLRRGVHGRQPMRTSPVDESTTKNPAPQGRTTRYESAGGVTLQAGTADSKVAHREVAGSYTSTRTGAVVCVWWAPRQCVRSVLQQSFEGLLFTARIRRIGWASTQSANSIVVETTRVVPLGLYGAGGLFRSTGSVGWDESVILSRCGSLGATKFPTNTLDPQLARYTPTLVPTRLQRPPRQQLWKNTNKFLHHGRFRHFQYGEHIESEQPSKQWY
jgi:hypothetical protein